MPSAGPTQYCTSVKGSYENRVKKYTCQLSFAKSSMQLNSNKLKSWVIHKILRGGVFWHRYYRCLIGLFDVPMLQLWFKSTSLMLCIDCST